MGGSRRERVARGGARKLPLRQAALKARKVEFQLKLNVALLCTHPEKKAHAVYRQVRSSEPV